MVFSQKDRQSSLDVIDAYSNFWLQMQSGSQGISGKRTINSMTAVDELMEFEIVDDENISALKEEDEFWLKSKKKEVLTSTSDKFLEFEKNKERIVVSEEDKIWTKSKDKEVLTSTFNGLFE